MSNVEDILGIQKEEESKPRVKLDLYNFSEGEEYFQKVRSKTLEQGLGVGCETLDAHFRYKQGNFVIVHGIDNVGKSSLCWWKLVAQNVFNQIKTVFYCTENKERQLIKNLLQYRCGKILHELTDIQFRSLQGWFEDNFKVIRINEDYNLEQVLDQVGEVQYKYGIHNAMIDPYNALSVPKGVNGHDYHLECCNAIKKHNRVNNLSTWINCHPNTEAYRNIDRDKDSVFVGHIKPPTKGHIDGGAKFSAKADEFLTYHRYTEHGSTWMYTQIFVRKVKDTETGGKPTPMNKPVTCKMNANGCGFSFDPQQTPIGLELIGYSDWVDPMQGYYSYGDVPIEQTEMKIKHKPKISIEQIEHNHRSGEVFKQTSNNFELPNPEQGDYNPKGNAPF